LVDVRFVCVPGVPGVKCTLDGVVKYSDSAGFANFYGLAIGSHTYAVEKQGWHFVSGYAPFMDSIPQSGTMIIPEGWPTTEHFWMDFEFEEGEAPIKAAVTLGKVGGILAGLGFVGLIIDSARRR